MTGYAMCFLRDLDELIAIYTASGWPPTLKALMTLRAQAALDVAPYLERLEWPRIPAVDEIDE